MEHSKESRTVFGFFSKEVSVEELRAKADALEREPYGADYVKPEAEATEKCMYLDTIEYPDRTVKIHCSNLATHYHVGYYGVVCYCTRCAREDGTKEAAEYRRRYRL